MRKVFVLTFMVISLMCVSQCFSQVLLHNLELSTLYQFQNSSRFYTSHYTEIYETPHFMTYYKEGHEIFALKAAELAEDIYEGALSFMLYTPSEKVNIFVLPSETRFYTWESSFADRAYASGRSWSIMLMYGCPFSTEILGWNYNDVRQALRHEMNHLLMYRILGDELYSTSLSTHNWLIEGTATYCEMYPSVSGEDLMLPAVLDYLKENDFPTSLEEITFDNYGRLSYPLGCSVIVFMFDTYGEEKFHTFLDAFAEWDPLQETSIQNLEGALKEAFGVSKGEFEREWSFYVKNNFKSENCTYEPVQITQPPGWNVPSSWYDSTILFVSDTHQNLDIYVMNRDGSVTQVTEDEHNDFDPKFSPDGTKIAYTSLQDGYAHIYIMNADGSNTRKVTTGYDMNVMGSWSPDGKTIAFTSGKSGNYDIYVMNADGSSVTQITYYEGDDGWPVFSPDGEKILFVSDRGGSYDVYVMNRDGSNVSQLTKTPGYENYPQYSPDGTKIAFISRWQTKSELCIMNSDGTGRRTLAVPPCEIIDTMARHRSKILGYPVWSPDGKEIAFTAVNQIFIVPVEEEPPWIYIAGISCCVLVVVLMLKMHQRRNLSRKGT